MASESDSRIRTLSCDPIPSWGSSPSLAHLPTPTSTVLCGWGQWRTCSYWVCGSRVRAILGVWTLLCQVGEVREETTCPGTSSLGGRQPGQQE